MTDLLDERRPVGPRGLPLPRLGLGTAPLGNLYRAVDDDTARGVLDTAWDLGVRHFDTAPHYGLGLAERRLGAALAGRPRDEVVVSTKVGRLLRPNPHPTGSDLAHVFEVPDDLTRVRDYSADGVRRSLEESLERMGLDRVDVVYVHDPDDHLDQAVAEAVPALAALRDEGVVGAVGAGMNQGPALERIVRESDVDVVMLAGRWTLLDRSGLPLLETCAERGVAVVAAAPYNSGILATDTPPADAHFDYGPAGPQLVARAHELAALAAAHGTRLPHAALHFPPRHPSVAAVVAGAADPDQVRALVEGARATVPPAFWAAADPTDPRPTARTGDPS
ncbi:aldo/keto reductase [Lapillicoccus jejuensis]|uniref:D-threo-aldose 1-dehydrogenase n=1 Tax=Lapillicoccus jejuensis TaxID=402171 RepID=A0A542DY48_9MICO|nr:aldo/keto reductase [Lapillicoccus jejuensis]TQJ07979.1 D-threo-aldose 1-dehydrogenase [Lapillicoccus jejuensis]